MPSRGCPEAGGGGGMSREARPGRRDTRGEALGEGSRRRLHCPEFSEAAKPRSASAAGSPPAWNWAPAPAGRAKRASGGEIQQDWPARAPAPPTGGDVRRRSCYLRRRGRVRPALAPALERNMYRFRSQLFTGISAAAVARAHPRRSSPLLLVEASPLSRPPHRPTSKKCSSIG